MYIKNMSGPKLEPWGTPQDTVANSDLVCRIFDGSVAVKQFKRFSSNSEAIF